MASGSAPVPGGEALLSGEGLSGDYPIQRHAGKVGYGPNYNAGASIVEKVEGILEEVTGKVIHKPNLVKEGHELHSGEKKKKKLLGAEEEEDRAFNKAHDGEKSKDAKSSIGQSTGKPPVTDPRIQTASTPTSRGKEPIPVANPATVPAKGADALEHVQNH